MKNSIKGDLSGDLNLQTDFMQIGVLNNREYTLPVIQCSTEKVRAHQHYFILKVFLKIHLFLAASDTE